MSARASASESDISVQLASDSERDETEDQQKVRVLLVCLGNICRSPLAEAVLKHTAVLRGLGDKVDVDSAGTAAYHVGEEPDVRTVQICKQNKIPIDSLARAVKPRDFFDFNYILAADRQNLANLERMKPRGATATVKLFGQYGDGKVIDDPYYGGMNGFQKAYEQCLSYSNGFLDAVMPNTPVSTGKKAGQL